MSARPQSPTAPTCCFLPTEGRPTWALAPPPAPEGTLARVPAAEADAAAELLFARHPEMQSWPADHGFAPFELQIDTLRLLDFFGGAHDLTPAEYFAADPGAAGEALPTTVASVA